MQKRSFIFIFLFVAFLGSFYFFRFPQYVLGANIDTPHVDRYVSGEVIVKYKKNKINLNTSSGRNSAENIGSEHSLGLKEHFSKENLSVFKINDAKSVPDKIIELKADPDVEYAEPDYIKSFSTISTNDTDKDLLWGLDNTGQTINGDQGNITGTANADINAPEAWNINEGSNGTVIVAVIDEGVLYTHPDLSINMWDGINCKDENGNALGGCNHGYDYRSNDKTPLPLSNAPHGTHVAGIIGAEKNNNAGVIGVAPHVKIMALRFALNVSTEVKAIDFAIQNGAKVINASFGGPDFSQAEHDAIQRFQTAGGIFVAAAGNDATSNDITHNYPSDYDLDNIIAVAATDQNDSLADFSNYGATSVDVGAPGVNILSTVIGNAYGYMSGTSMATPYTAGLTALVWGYKPTLSATDVKSIILNSGDALSALSGKTVSGKRINADRSLFGADIIAAQELHNGAVEGASPGQYIVGSKATFQTAIDTATGVESNSGSTPSDIATGVTNLDTATATFITSIVPADFTALNSAIASDQILHDGATESTTPGDHVVGSKIILQTAIDTASALPGTSSQLVVDAMVVTLNSAVTTFNSSIVPPSDLSALTNAITNAESLLTLAVEGTSPGQYAVGSKAILQSAIDDAGVLVDTLPQATIDAGLVTLNTAVATFNNGMVDNTPPVITLLGDSSVTIKFGATYTDAGATATDNKDGNITSSIVTVNPVDTHAPATYTVTYNVSDTAGNPATQVTRTVIVSHQVSSGGGGGGGGGGNSKPSTKTITPDALPSDCTPSFLFSPSTGKPCGNSTNTQVSDPARYLFNTPTTGIPYVFSLVLKMGMSGANVLALQKYLNTHGFIISASGVGSVGNETVYFGQKTKDAVIKFQLTHNLIADGVVGPMTGGLMK